MRRAFYGLILVISAAACGGGGKAYIPVDSPIKPWQAPEVEEPVPPAEAPAPDASGK